MNIIVYHLNFQISAEKIRRIPVYEHQGSRLELFLFIITLSKSFRS